MKNITHPLDRLKLIADPVIRKQAVENFSQEYYNKNQSDDDGGIILAIGSSFSWYESPQGYDYWSSIVSKIPRGGLPLLPEPIEDNPTSEIDQLKLENEKLRECLKISQQLLQVFIDELEIKINDVYMGKIKQHQDEAKQLLNQK